MSFKVTKIDSNGKQFEVDIVIYSDETRAIELTFDRSEIEAKGIEWGSFVKSVHEVLSELEVKEEASRFVFR